MGVGGGGGGGIVHAIRKEKTKVSYTNGKKDEFKRGFVTDLNRFLNSQNLYLCRRKPKTIGPILLTIAILER